MSSAIQETMQSNKEYPTSDGRPMGDYLNPPLQGYRLREGTYRPIRATKGRLPSRALGLQLERIGKTLRLFDPAANRLLPTAKERVEHAEAENERLRQEVDELRRRLRGKNGLPKA